MNPFIALMVVVSLSGVASAQSLREAAARGARPESTFSNHFPMLSIQEITRLSDLVLHGQIAKVESRLAYGDVMVVTEYTITPLRILKGQPHGATTAMPAPTELIVVRRAGGTLVEGETHFRTFVESFPERESFTTGEQVVMFLVYSAEIRRYQLTDGPYAAFHVTKDGVMPMKKAAEKRGDTPRPLASFLAELEEEIERKR